MLNILVTTALLVTLPLAQVPRPPNPPPEATPEPPLYRASVDLVVLHATVRDAAGRLLADLSQDNFEIREDGAPQSIRLFRTEDLPVTVGLVVDHSGSMSAKIADVIAAAGAFVRASNSRDQMFVVNFNERVSLGLAAPARFSNRSEDLEAAIRRDPAVGETALFDATFLALAHLRAGGSDKSVLIVISDGADNASRRSLDEVLQSAGQSATLIYTIGVFAETDVDQNTRALKRLAQATGGEAFFPRRSADVVQIAERIAREIRSQYTIGYVSTKAVHSSAYRRIRVVGHTSSGSRVSVRTRSGYFPSSAGVRP